MGSGHDEEFDAFMAASWPSLYRTAVLMAGDAQLAEDLLQTKRPPAHPTELTDPCCLPALGELGEMPPHGGLARV